MYLNAQSASVNIPLIDPKQSDKKDCQLNFDTLEVNVIETDYV